MRQPRVAIITSNYWPEQTGIGQVTTEFAEFLQSNGIRVAVATAAPYYPEWRIRDDYRGSIWKTEQHKGVAIYRAAHYAVPNPTTWKRLLHEFSLCAASLPNMVRALKGSTEAFIVSPDLSHAFVGSVVARMMRVPITVVVQDVMPDAAIEMGMLSNKYAIALSRWLASGLYAASHRIFTLSEGMSRRIGAAAAVQERLSVVPNTVDEAELGDRPGLGARFRQRFVPAGAFCVLHSGNMGEKQDLRLLLRAADRMRNNAEVHFLVFGDGAFKPTFLRLKESWQLANVSHFPLQERSLLPDMLHGADVCLVSQAARVVDVVVPSKLITAMAAGAMIVAACPTDSETAKILEASGGGLIIPPGDDQALVDVVDKLRSGGVDTAEHRRRVRTYALKHFSRDAVYRPIVQRLTGRANQVHRLDRTTITK